MPNGGVNNRKHLGLRSRSTNKNDKQKQNWLLGKNRDEAVDVKDVSHFFIVYRLQEAATEKNIPDLRIIA